MVKSGSKWVNQAQQEALGAICEHWYSQGQAPTIRDVARRLGVSRSTAHDRVQALADLGALEPGPGPGGLCYPVGLRKHIIGYFSSSFS